MLKINVLLFITCFLLLSACKTKEEQGLEGMWSIDVIHYKTFDIRRCLAVNVLSFEENTCTVPTLLSCDGLEQSALLFLDKPEDPNSWSIRKSKDGLLLNIVSQSKIFNGNHSLKFVRDDENKLLGIEFTSDSLYLLCHKGLFDYDRNYSLVKKLTE